MFGLLATVLIAMKAARILSEPSSWTDADPEEVSIDLTFSIKSLYETLTDLVERFFGQFNGTSLEEADATLDTLHGWGGHKNRRWNILSAIQPDARCQMQKLFVRI